MRREPDGRTEIASTIDDDPPWTCLAQPFARGRCLAHLHLTDGRIDRDIEQGDHQLADLSPITNDGDNIRPSAPPHADAAAGFQPSAASFEVCAFGLQNSGRKTNRHSLDV